MSDGGSGIRYQRTACRPGNPQASKPCTIRCRVQQRAQKGEYMNNLVDRFLHYTSFDTQSNENSVTFPSTEKQFVLAHDLGEELKSLGLTDSSVDPNGYVTATLPANCESPDTVPVIAFLAHMDTSPDASGMGVKPRIVTAYDGKDIVLNAEKNMVVSPTDFPDMLLHKGEDFIVADGLSLIHISEPTRLGM